MEVVHLQYQEIGMKDLSQNEQGVANHVLELRVQGLEQEGSFLLGQTCWRILQNGLVKNIETM